MTTPADDLPAGHVRVLVTRPHPLITPAYSGTRTTPVRVVRVGPLFDRLEDAC